MSPSLVQAHAQSGLRLDRETGHLVLWLDGEHDLAGVGSLDEVLAAVTAAGGGDLVVELSGVTFIDASVLGALAGGRNALAARSHTLAVRAPPRAARRLLDLCGLVDLIAAGEGPTGPSRS